jgi:hypothetical protein
MQKANTTTRKTGISLPVLGENLRGSMVCTGCFELFQIDAKVWERPIGILDISQEYLSNGLVFSLNG